MLLSPFFDVLTPEERSAVTKVTTLRTLKRGEILWRMGEKVDHLAIVRNGFLCTPVDVDGAGETLAAVFKKDDTLLLAIEGGLPCPLTIRALTAADIAWIPIANVMNIVGNNLKVLGFAFRVAIERLNAQRFLSAVLFNATLERRLAYAYWSMASPGRNGRMAIDIKVAQGDIAKLIGTSREEVSRKTKLLQQTGYLSVEGGLIELSEELPTFILLETIPPPFLAAEFKLA